MAVVAVAAEVVAGAMDAAVAVARLHLPVHYDDNNGDGDASDDGGAAVA